MFSPLKLKLSLPSRNGILSATCVMVLVAGCCSGSIMIKIIFKHYTEELIIVVISLNQQVFKKFI